MNINVRGKNIEITPALREHVEKRLRRVTRFFEDLREVYVILKVEKGRHIVEVTIPLNGITLRGEESSPDMYASVDMVVDKLEKQLSKHKEKLKKYRATTFRDELLPAFTGKDEERLVKTKSFTVKPMQVEEAILQMNLLGHDFYVFSNADTEQVNVIYRRKDGDYGLLEPAR
ncbi:MAG: ribosome-associated translation inhibitor RaiA [Bacillota bacterium]